MLCFWEGRRGSWQIQVSLLLLPPWLREQAVHTLKAPSLHHQPVREPPPRVGGGAPGWGHPCAGQPAAPNVSPDVSRRPEVSGLGLSLRSAASRNTA